MKNPKAEDSVAPATTSRSHAVSIPRSYNIFRLGEHTAYVTAVQGSTLYLNGSALVRVGQRFELYRLIAAVRDNRGDPVEVNPVHVGDITITESSDRLVGTYTGQAIHRPRTYEYVIVIEP
jgi:hypothetical protein